jgi:hypothetical protein
MGQTLGEDVLKNIAELFKSRNRLVHAQPERLYASYEEDAPPDVARRGLASGHLLVAANMYV